MRQASFLILILVILIVLFITNPGTDDFASWVIEDRSDEGLVQDLISIIGEPMISEMAERNNYFIFSIFELSAEGVDEELKAVGIAGNFIKR